MLVKFITFINNDEDDQSQQEIETKTKFYYYQIYSVFLKFQEPVCNDQKLKTKKMIMNLTIFMFSMKKLDLLNKDRLLHLSNLKTQDHLCKHLLNILKIKTKDLAEDFLLMKQNNCQNEPQKYLYNMPKTNDKANTNNENSNNTNYNSKYNTNASIQKRQQQSERNSQEVIKINSNQNSYSQSSQQITNTRTYQQQINCNSFWEKKVNCTKQMGLMRIFMQITIVSKQIQITTKLVQIFVILLKNNSTSLKIQMMKIKVNNQLKIKLYISIFVRNSQWISQVLINVVLSTNKVIKSHIKNFINHVKQQKNVKKNRVVLLKKKVKRRKRSRITKNIKQFQDIIEEQSMIISLQINHYWNQVNVLRQYNQCLILEKVNILISAIDQIANLYNK
ncbi:unnamed protein product [Paramecium octaurelia]|uniref:Uncharacterized protein n=1 Tax=Paramecium octaurelia TaxID=43137 RepID=A0A8S1U9V7_PAROT|nr:unnamed protein product [Paramecium octaurelia]